MQRKLFIRLLVGNNIFNLALHFFVNQQHPAGDFKKQGVYGKYMDGILLLATCLIIIVF